MIKDGRLFKAQDLAMKRAPASADASDRPEKPPLVSTFAHLGPPKSDRECCARERIDARKYDVEAWEMLADEAQSRPIAQATGLFEQLVATFPTSGKYWKMYVEAHMNSSNDDAVRHVFSRCLLSCFYLDLWKCYIKFIRKVNEQRGPDGREETRQAFEFMFGHIGMDISAGPLWLEYIAFLKTMPVTSPQEETYRLLLVRKAYQQAATSPIHHAEQIARDYEAFENSINRALAKSILAEFQPKSLCARAVYRERKKFWDPIDPSLLPVPPTGSFKEQQQNASWKQLLVFEKSNPQRLEPGLLAKRVVFTYEQCLMHFYHYPDIWYDYAMWHAQGGSNENAVVVFKRAVTALPDVSLLYYAYAEFEEARGCIKEARKVYETLVGNEKIADCLAFIQFMRFVRRAEGIEAARKVFTEARKSPSCTYHLYVAYASMVFTIDKDAKTARDIFEVGLNQYIHEPNYVIEYADFLCRVNDDRNARALFERALNVLPVEESVEVWNRFVAFEQTFGDIPSMLKVTQRRKDALTGDDGQSLASPESSLQQMISRYRFSNLWPCSTQELDHLAQQQIMLQKMEEKQLQVAKRAPNSGATPAKSFIRPDVSQMTTYEQPGPSSEEIVKILPPTVKSFLNQLPPVVEGPIPDVDLVLSIFLENEIPTITGLNGSIAKPSSAKPAARQLKRKELEKQQEDNEGGSTRPAPAPAPASTATAAAPRDVFRMRQLQRSRASMAVNPAISSKQAQTQSTSSNLSSES